MELLGIELSFEEYDYLICEQNKGKELVVKDSKVIAQEKTESYEQQTLNRISYLKSLLSSTDYKALKYLEGSLSYEEYEPIKQQRISWRNEINDLEANINKDLL